MSWLALGFGLVLVIEGLVFALAPSRIDSILEMMASLSHEHRRMIGLIAVATGVALVWIGRSIGV